MLVTVKSVFNCNSDRFFDEIRKSKSLLYISKPLIKFKSLRRQLLPRELSEGKYLVKMYLLGLIPLGKQWIVITIDPNKKLIRDNGYSKLISKWDHQISLINIGNHKTLYTDAIEIDAGVLTPVIGVFAYIFYRWRQKRWKKLIKRNFNYDS
ncbi:hypothetical protein B0H99_11082 [Planomicrobium soli]|uniref:Ligand-binding SRPBCC domain-containing protein n=1 Tax=Planomicrobium soli TaxID=1176648 RepID=A0A2P8GG64_9BACL|nr:hypothetical protein [Planomicrobium soli]PSL32972.1 hypothetical protein B0H99_11082 [Planomicrobium soli]